MRCEIQKLGWDVKSIVLKFLNEKYYQRKTL